MTIDFWKGDLWRSEYVRIISTTQDDIFTYRELACFNQRTVPAADIANTIPILALNRIFFIYMYRVLCFEMTIVRSAYEN